MARRVPPKTRRQTARARITATAAPKAPPAELDPEPDEPDALTLLHADATALMREARTIPMTAELLREMSAVEWVLTDKPIRTGGVSFAERVKRLRAQIARERSGG